MQQHGTARFIQTQNEFYWDGKGNFINGWRRRMKNVNFDPYVHPALVTAGCVVKRAFFPGTVC